MVVQMSPATEAKHLEFLMERSCARSRCGYTAPPTPQPSPAEGPARVLTVEADPDLGVVVFVGNLPDIEGLRGRVGRQAEEEDDGVGRGQAFRVDLPVSVQKRHTCSERQKKPPRLGHAAPRKLQTLPRGLAGRSQPLELGPPHHDGRGLAIRSVRCSHPVLT